MAKIVVLLGNAGEQAAEIAVAAAGGAKGVRFAEVEIRTLGKASIATNAPRRPLASADPLREYDAIIVVSAERYDWVRHALSHQQEHAAHHHEHQSVTRQIRPLPAD